MPSYDNDSPIDQHVARYLKPCPGALRCVCAHRHPFACRTAYEAARSWLAAHPDATAPKGFGYSRKLRREIAIWYGCPRVSPAALRLAAFAEGRLGLGLMRESQRRR